MKKRLYFLCYALFFILFLMSILYVYQEVNTNREATANRNAILSNLSGLFDELSEKLEIGDEDAVNYISEFILRCGYLSSVSQKNSACIYDFLSRLRSGHNIDKVSSSVYARRCADCILQELKGRGVLLDRYNETNSKDVKDTQFKQTGMHLQSISGETRCLYNSNIYQKYISSEKESIEYVDLVDHSKRSSFSEIYFVDSKYLFSDYGIDFYCCGNGAQMTILGFDNNGRVRYYKKS